MNKLVYILWIAISNIRIRKIESVGRHFRIGLGLHLVNPKHITIGNNFSGRRNLKLQTWEIDGYDPHIIIGDNVAIMDNCQISCIDKINIGNGVLIGENVLITDNFHGNSLKNECAIPPHQRRLFSKGTISIGDNAWIGRNVCIMPGVIIGDGAIIGANAVVTKNIPAYAKACGVPATVISIMKD